MNTRNAILYGDDCIEYRELFMTTRDMIGFPSSYDPYNGVINYTFNFDNVFKIAVKSFTWVSCVAAGNTSFNAYLKSTALTQYDLSLQNSSKLGPGIVEIIPMGTTANNVPGQINRYEPINLHWHKFSPNNTINNIDFELLGINGQEFAIDPTVPEAGFWNLELIIALRSQSYLKYKEDYSILNWG